MMHQLTLLVWNDEHKDWGVLRTVEYNDFKVKGEMNKAQALKYLNDQKNQWQRTVFLNKTMRIEGGENA